MLTEDVLKFYGSRRAVQEALKVTRTAVYQWGKVVPLTSALRLQQLTGGRLKVVEKFYDGIRIHEKYRKSDRHGAQA